LKKHLLTYALLAGLVAGLVAVGMHLRGFFLPGDQQGYEPIQPIAFSHKLHAGSLEINCLYCHFAAAKGPHAGIPPASLCMNCHRLVTASWEATRAEAESARQAARPPRRIVSDELRKLYQALALNDELQPEPGKQPQPIRWVRVHSLPQYTRFDHRAHVTAKVACQECHGSVQTLEVMRQSADLSMGWCLRCHKEHREIDGRKVSPSTDCAVCHY
jgi:hypothetical protein